MATTRKRTASKKKEMVVKEVENPTVLSPEHLRVIEVSERDIRIAQLEMSTEEQSYNNMVLSLRLLENKIEKQKEVLSAKAHKYETSKKRYMDIKKEIWPQYGLEASAGLGYNPDTGEIIKN